MGVAKLLRSAIPRLIVGLLCCLAASGIACRSKKTGLDNPYSQSPEQTAANIFAEYDANKDNVLDAAELERCPSLKTLLDTLGKRSISAAELTEHLRINQSGATRPASVRCLVTLDDVPLAGAVVTLTPEAFHGTGLPTVIGTTGEDGRAELSAKDGVANAFYRISISMRVGGQETLPAIYNSATTLGAEVGATTVSRAGRLEFHLRTR
jgi:hypothetical protein